MQPMMQPMMQQPMMQPQPMMQQPMMQPMMQQPMMQQPMMQPQSMMQQPMMQQPQQMMQQPMMQQPQQMMQQPLVQSQPMLQQPQQMMQQPQAGGSVYNEPSWSSGALYRYRLRVIENGLVSYIELNGKNCFIIGRLPTCDISFSDNPSISRHHAVIQHRGGGGLKGFDEVYIFDLGSTSGTFINGQMITARTYYALQPSDIINFGSSTEFVLCGGPNNFEPPLPPPQQPKSLPFAAEPSLERDDTDAIIHAKPNERLLEGLRILDEMLMRGILLEEEYYRRKCILQEKLQQQQEKMRLDIIKKKQEARLREDMERQASEQRAQQNALKQAKGILKASAPATSYQDNAAQSMPSYQQSESKTHEEDIKQVSPLDSLFSSKKGGVNNYSTIKFDPKSRDFDAVAYKRLMVEKYEKQQAENAITLRLKQLGDPTSPSFDPVEYKRLMIERYEATVNI